MNTWILILTLIPDHNYGGAAIQQIPGFGTVDSCLQAGNSWISKQESVQDRLNFNPTAICIEQFPAQKL